MSLANTSSAVVLNGLVEGVRALAAATAAPPQVASKTHSRALSSSSAFAKRMTRQAPSNSISSTTTTTTTTATSSSADASPRLSQSSMSSVAEEKPNVEKVEVPPEGDVSRNEDATPASAPVSTKRALIAQQPQQQQRSPTSPKHPLSVSSKTVRRHSRDSRVPLSDALKSLTGESSNLGKRASVGGVSSTSASISGMNPLGTMGLGRANLGETAQGWVDSVGSKLAELQRGQT